MYKSEIIRLIPYPFSQISKFAGNLPIALKFSILTRFIAVRCVKRKGLPSGYAPPNYLLFIPTLRTLAFVLPLSAYPPIHSSAPACISHEDPILPYASAFARFGSSQYFRGIPFSLKSPPLLCISVSFNPPTNPSARFGSSQNIRCIPFFPEVPNPGT